MRCKGNASQRNIKISTDTTRCQKNNFDEGVQMITVLEIFLHKKKIIQNTCTPPALRAADVDVPSLFLSPHTQKYKAKMHVLTLNMQVA